MPTPLFNSINPEQQQAVLATEGPIIILAGAGSGKTRVLMYKVLYLIEEKHIPPDNILCVTFTNKAAKEMNEKILKENNAVDFDDLILQTVQLFRHHPEVLQKYQEKFRYILVDEYQDTNKAQYTLTKMLSERWKNICVVGDFSQSIYSWRGADFRNLSKFKIDFPGTSTFTLSQNYRSTQKILDAASGVIANNTSHPVLKLCTQNPN